MKNLAYFLFICLILFSACKKKDEVTQPTCPTSDLKLNQIQVIASHNSYRVHTYQPIFDFVIQMDLPPEYDPSGWDYTHIPIEEQFNQYNIRGFELDIYHDPTGGLFYYRKGNLLVGETDTSFIPELLQPGFKMMHIPDFDYMSNYITFKQGLVAIKNWSDAHPNHLPIFINIEPKSESVKDALPTLNLTQTLKYNANAMDSIDMEIKDVFGATTPKILKPDDVRGTETTLRNAIINKGWPKLDDCRGKIMFILDNEQTLYTQNHPSLQGRVMFTYAAPNSPEAAFIVQNDSKANKDSITKYVTQGFIVRTRADSNTDQARVGDYSYMNAAFESGAQIISTDYYKPDYRSDTSANWSSYKVSFGNNTMFRPNPINSTNKCPLTE